MSLFKALGYFSVFSDISYHQPDITIPLIYILPIQTPLVRAWSAIVYPCIPHYKWQDQSKIQLEFKTRHKLLNHIQIEVKYNILYAFNVITLAFLKGLWSTSDCGCCVFRQYSCCSSSGDRMPHTSCKKNNLTFTQMFLLQISYNENAMLKFSTFYVTVSVSFLSLSYTAVCLCTSYRM